MRNPLKRFRSDFTAVDIACFNLDMARARSADSEKASPSRLRGVDPLTPAHRSWNMSRVRSTNTKPERVVRSILHGLGFRFRLDSKIVVFDDQAGRRRTVRPDVVLRSRRIAVFVHGCFWHRHKNCRYATTPTNNCEYWAVKFERNVERDQRTARLLGNDGWKVVTLWECEVKDVERTRRKLESRLCV
jgi:DNA mismatch endonuclease (patch repair protein)